MEETANLKLPYIMPSQAQKHVTHNEALRMLDALVQLSALDRDRTAPPSAPGDGDRHIVGPQAGGAWDGRDGQIAAWQDGAWAYFQPAEGWRAWVAQEQGLVVFHDGQWEPLGGGLENLDMVGINATADAINRLAVASESALLSHDGEGHQLKINKAASGDTASLLFQTDFSGRAEMGIAGDDDFHVKVSPDGNAWDDAMVIAAADAVPSFPKGLRLGSGADVLGGFETGSFTPVLTFASPGNLSVSYAEQTGVYWRIGDLMLALVHISATPTYSTATGQLRIGGLPAIVDHPMVANTFQHGGSTTYPMNATTLVTRPEAGTDYFTCLGIGPGVANTLTVNNVPSGQGFVARAMLVYRAAS